MKQFKHILVLLCISAMLCGALSGCNGGQDGFVNRLRQYASKHLTAAPAPTETMWENPTEPTSASPTTEPTAPQVLPGYSSGNETPEIPLF